MKNKVLLFLVCAFSWGHSYAQMSPHYENLDKYKVIDSAYIKCSYQLTYLRDSTKTNSPLTDIQTLLIGTKVSKYYSQKALDHNKKIKKEFETADAYPNFPDGVWSIEVFKNYPQGKETVTDIGSMLHGNYVYEEELPALNWMITNEKQTILSYNCQKAIALFRGREYIAWFTPDIPVPNGPWKLGGLPGLILKVSDTKRNFVFECDGLEQLNNKEAIKFYTVEYTKINHNNLNKLYQRIYNDFAAYNKSLGIQTMEMNEKTGQSKIVEHSSRKIPYNPIELE